MLTGTDVTARQEFSAQWHALRALFCDVGHPPSIDELLVVFKASFKVEGGLAELQEEMWAFFIEQGCLTVPMLRDIQDNVPPSFADRAERLLVEMRARPAQTKLPFHDEEPRMPTFG